MIHRIFQFYRAMTAKLTRQDRRWVRSRLPQRALPLFFAMHRVDQYHALHVARTALELLEDLPAEKQNNVSQPFLMRCALLHDVGRVRGDLDIWGKVFCVLMMHFLPALAKKMECVKAEHIWQKFGHALYVYEHHADIGAKKLRAIGLNAEAEIILRHHRLPRVDDPIELTLLRIADDRN